MPAPVLLSVMDVSLVPMACEQSQRLRHAQQAENEIKARSCHGTRWLCAHCHAAHKPLNIVQIMGSATSTRWQKQPLAMTRTESVTAGLALLDPG